MLQTTTFPLGRLVAVCDAPAHELHVLQLQRSALAVSFFLDAKGGGIKCDVPCLCGGGAELVPAHYIRSGIVAAWSKPTVGFVFVPPVFHVTTFRQEWVYRIDWAEAFKVIDQLHGRRPQTWNLVKLAKLK